MNVHRGGSLTQFLPDEAREPNLDHRRDPAEPTRRHPVRLAPDTALADAVGHTDISANSRHKQAIKKLGHGLRVIATAPDGIIEAVDDPSLPLFLGIQWHPENLSTEPEHLAPFKMLVEKASSQEKH
jgi:putative glutamine amidotransferase